VPQKEHKRVSETGVFPSLDRVSLPVALRDRDISLVQFKRLISHLYSLRDFWRHFGLCGAAVHSDCCVFAPCTNILTYLLTSTDQTLCQQINLSLDGIHSIPIRLSQNRWTHQPHRDSILAVDQWRQ